MKPKEAEYWLRGPLSDITALLQPVAHTLLQAKNEINEMMQDCNNDVLWQMPAGVASPAFHLQHIAGVLDRLFAYADNRQLTEEQLSYLAKEGKKDASVTVLILLETIDKQIGLAIDFLKIAKAETLTEMRCVGRKNIPSTQLGLLFHAAEHTMRHTGQLFVTMKVILSKK